MAAILSALAQSRLPMPGNEAVARSVGEAGVRDVGRLSSWNEQDSRYWSRFAHLPLLETEIKERGIAAIGKELLPKSGRSAQRHGAQTAVRRTVQSWRHDRRDRAPCQLARDRHQVNRGTPACGRPAVRGAATT